MENNTKKSNKELVIVEPKPIEEKPTAPAKVENIRIDKIGRLTLNVFTKPLKERYEKHYKKEKIYLITDILLAVIVVILLGVILNLYIFSKSNKAHLIDFQVSSTPTELINGQATDFVINYANKTKTDLQEVNLVLKIPAGLQEPKYDIADFDLKTNTLQIGTLPALGHGQLKISGFLLGNYNEKQEFLAVLNYKNRYGQSRQEFFDQEFQLTDSVLQTTIEMPGKIIARSKFDAKINLKNQSDLDFTKVKIKMLWPDNYYLKQASLGEPTATNLWTVGQLNKTQEETHTFTGRVYSDQPQDLNFQSEIYATYQQKEYLLAKTSQTIPLDFSKFELSFINQENNRSIRPGGETTYTLHYKNNENYALENVQIGLEITGEYADIVKPAGFDRNNAPELIKLEPQAQGSFEVIAKAKANINFTAYRETGYQLEARIIASYDDPLQKSRVNLESAPLLTRIDSNLILKDQAMFYTQQGDQIGVGSIPPRVGEYTSYWAIIQINNTNNKIANVQVRAKLPEDIEFTNIYNVTDGQQIHYNEKNKTIEWNIEKVQAFAGIFNPAPEARIQLAITPSMSQVGKSPLLLTNITVTATDSQTNTFLSTTGKNISIAIFPDQSLNKVIE